jgi:hypothetical protein
VRAFDGYFLAFFFVSKTSLELKKRGGREGELPMRSKGTKEAKTRKRVEVRWVSGETEMIESRNVPFPLMNMRQRGRQKKKKRPRRLTGTCEEGAGTQITI